MKKAAYIAPAIKFLAADAEEMLTSSIVGGDPDGGVLPIEEPHDDEFNAPATGIWDE